MKRPGRPRIPGIRRRLRCVSSAIRRRWCCWMGVRRVLLAGIRSAGSLSVNLVVDNFRLSRGAFIASLKSCFPGWLAATLFIGTLLGHGPTLQYLIVKIVDNPGLNPYAAISGDGVSTTVQFADWILEAYFWPYLL